MAFSCRKGPKGEFDLALRLYLYLVLIRCWKAWNAVVTLRRPLFHRPPASKKRLKHVVSHAHVQRGLLREGQDFV